MVSTLQLSQGLLNEHDVAQMTGMSVSTVRRWRLRKEGPKFLKLNAAVRYRSEDVASWLESRPTGGDGGAKGK